MVHSNQMPRKKTGKQGKQLRRAEAQWEWRKRYRVWDASRRVFLYPENWIEPELRLSPTLRAALRGLATLICVKCDQVTKRTRKPARRKGVHILLTGKDRTGVLIAAQTLARDLEKNLYRVDLGAVVSKYIGETEKNLSSVFDASKKSGAILFFDEADALFGKRTAVKDSHDRYANIEFKYLLQRIEKRGGLTILATSRRASIDKPFLRRLHFVISISARRKARSRKLTVR